VTGGEREIRLHRALRLAHTSHRRFDTLQMTIRCWEDAARICDAQGIELADDERPEPREWLVRVWVDARRPRASTRATWPPRRYRVEDVGWLTVCDLPRWWVVDRNSGVVRSWLELGPRLNRPDDVADPWFHFADVRWLKRWRGTAVRGTTEVAGRPAVVVAARETMFDIAPGSDRKLHAIDLERGVLLRAECFLGDALLAVEEVVEIAFDEDLAAGLFDEPGLDAPAR
jgi:hypothetical protein